MGKICNINCTNNSDVLPPGMAGEDTTISSGSWSGATGGQQQFSPGTSNPSHFPGTSGKYFPSYKFKQVFRL